MIERRKTEASIDSPGRSRRGVRRLFNDIVASIPHGRWLLIGSLLLATAATAASVALMGVSAWLLSRAAEHPPVLYLQAAAVGVRFFGISRPVARYFERVVGHDLALRMQGVLRLRTYDKLSGTTLLGRRRGDLLVRVTQDIDAIMDLVVRVLLPLCSASIVLIGTSLILTLFSPLFAAVLLITSVFAGIIVPWLAQRWSLAADQDAVPARGELGDRVREISRSAPDLVAYGVADMALDRLHETDARLRAAERRGAWTQGLGSALQMAATGIAVVAALLIGAPAVASGDLLARGLAVLVLVPLALNESFADLSKAAQTFTRARTSLDRVLALLDAPKIGRGDHLVDDQQGQPGILQVKDVTVGWPDAEPLLQGLSFSVDHGEAVALTGPSGLGKTTLAATIMGLIEPLAGEIDTPTRVAYLAQDAHIFATTVRENVRIGNNHATEEQVTDALRRAGLAMSPDRVVGEQGATLSGGEAQRIALARVLVAEKPADLVILDEPTEHLDQETASSLLDDLFRELGEHSMVVISHDADLIARCDRQINLVEHATTQRVR